MTPNLTNIHEYYFSPVQYTSSGLVVKSNVAIVGPRVRFSAGRVTFFQGTVRCLLDCLTHYVVAEQSAE
ncbi:hypothetical protein THAOC_29334 [Thalassiosira oceanica]|uniref:Uncharacterized protein n=1 Tax=Thalassiosira oceanica TaxID=159749 RepID=K0RRD7_THAOC|nr:hypothetical protein THAOC_29334 [Thalassiosira oceanica]|eukprot:EJK51491.1 hypothetical protein THAOC_29334 [Thalassiosira oceanica]